MPTDDEHFNLSMFCFFLPVHIQIHSHTASKLVFHIPLFIPPTVHPYNSSSCPPPSCLSRSHSSFRIFFFLSNFCLFFFYSTISFFIFQFAVTSGQGFSLMREREQPRKFVAVRGRNFRLWHTRSPTAKNVIETVGNPPHTHPSQAHPSAFLLDRGNVISAFSFV